MDSPATVLAPGARKPPPLLRTILILTTLYLFEYVEPGMFMVSIPTSFIGVLLLVPLGMWAASTDDTGARPLARSRFLRAGMYLLLGAASLGTLNYRMAAWRSNAERVIHACQAYKSRRGAFPERLADLVPADLPAIPPRLQYWSTAEQPPHHVLSYIAIPPLFRRYYQLEEGRWSGGNPN